MFSFVEDHILFLSVNLKNMPSGQDEDEELGSPSNWLKSIIKMPFGELPCLDMPSLQAARRGLLLRLAPLNHSILKSTLTCTLQSFYHSILNSILNSALLRSFDLVFL
jgi:hypothetical protein